MPSSPAGHDPAHLAELNRRYLWHPFTQMQDYTRGEPLIIARGEGMKLQDVHGRWYWDGVASIWLNVHGHHVPELDAAIRAQLEQVAHATLLGQANVPAVLLAERLVKLMPPGLTRIFYSDSGAEAVEIALKMAFHYWRHRGQAQRQQFIRCEQAYHGDTIGAVSLGGIPLFHETYRALLFPTIGFPYPHPYRFAGTPEACVAASLAALAEILEHQGNTIAGVIVEPIVQGAAGIIVSPPGWLRGVRRLCDQYGVLLLADEVATGFGRTGRLWACQHEDVIPDLMMVAKGLTGGYLPLAATVASEEIYRAFLGEFRELKTFFHGHSYTGNPLGCAVALASLDLLEQRELVAQTAAHEALVRAALAPLLDLPRVGDLRGKGLIFGLELVQDQASKTPFPYEERWGWRVCDRCRELGLLLRPLGNVIVFIPPLAATRDDLLAMCAILSQAVREVVA